MAEDIVRDFGFLTLGTRLKRLGDRLQADTQKIIDAHGVKVQVSHFPFLAAAARLGPLTVGEIAEAVGITQPGATRTVAQLCDAGLLQVRAGKDDQRHRIVSLSEKGRRLVAEAERDLWPRIAAAVADLCTGLDGPLLEQLAGIEEGLAEASLERRGQKAAT